MTVPPERPAPPPRAPARASAGAAATAAAGDVLAAARLSSGDVGPDGALLVAALARWAGRAGDELCGSARSPRTAVAPGGAVEPDRVTEDTA